MSASTAETRIVRRVSTGNARVDDLLHGGFPASSINVIMGHPGTGKTVLAEQILFNNAGPDERVLYISTLSEPMSKMVTYLQGFDFYDEAKLLDQVRYDDVGPGLLAEGPSFLEERLELAIRTDRPRVIVIDSFKAVHDLEPTTSEMRRLVARVTGLLSAYDVTTFLVGEYDREHIPLYPEFAAADGIIELSRQALGRRDDRYLRVLKLRGSGYREGQHAFRIGRAGLEVFPRTVTPGVAPEYTSLSDRVTTGVPELDRMLGGGLWRGSSAAVAGPAGAGKTSLALTFGMDGVQAGEPTLYVNFQENPVQLARALRSMGHDPENLEERGFHALYLSPVELHIDSVVVRMFDVIEERGIRRVIIDALGDLTVSNSDLERFHDFLYAVTQRLAARGVTSLLTVEQPDASMAAMLHRTSSVASLVDTIFGVGVDLASTPPRRWLRIVKARALEHPLGPRTLRIGRDGVHLDAEQGT